MIYSMNDAALVKHISNNGDCNRSEGRFLGKTHEAGINLVCRREIMGERTLIDGLA